MPKKKTKTDPNAKPGVVRQYLIDNYPITEECLSDVCKAGHVFHIYLSNDKSCTKTVAVILELFNITVPLSKVQTLSRNLSSIKDIKIESKLKMFADLCSEVIFSPECEFSASPGQSLPHESVPSTSSLLPQTPSKSSNDTATEQETPKRYELRSATKSSNESVIVQGTPKRYTLRSDANYTPRKALMKKRLSFLSESNRKSKLRSDQKIKDLRNKILSAPNKIRVLKQNLVRKEVKIAELKLQVKTSHVSDHAQKLNFELKKMKAIARKSQMQKIKEQDEEIHEIR